MTAGSRTAAPTAQTGAPRRGGTVWLGTGVILLALNLRPALVAVSPLAPTIKAASGMSSAELSLLTSLPLLCFGLLAPLAPRAGRRWGLERTLLGSMAFVLGGPALRLVAAEWALFGGSVLVGAGIAVANVLLPALIKRDFAGRTGLMTGLYSMSLFGGAALAAGVTVPVGTAAGLDWRTTLACWGFLAAVAIGVWAPRARAAGPVPRTGARAVRGLWSSPLVWAVTLYMGLQSLNYYAAAAWLPTVLESAGMDAGQAGWMLSLSSLLGITGSFLAPVVSGRRLGAGAIAVLGAVLCGAGFAGLLAAPVGGAYLWMVLLGLGQGAAISLALLFIVQRAPDARIASQLSSNAQGFGYVLAAFGPAVLGASHDATGSWTLPLVLLAAALLPQALCGALASRDRLVAERPRIRPQGE
jgi:CP family cyanate transporter-like MFS transporter